MAKQLNVNLAFTADTSQAKMQLQDLQNQLNKITTGTKIGTGIKADIQEAIKAASELSVHLKKATNLETGNLDFAKFNRSLQQSGMSLQQYGASLQKLGPQGQQAFMSLAQSVATSEIPIRRSNTLVKELGVTLANTARWQLSSSMLHGFMSAVQSAYGYAQDLNESLNNIRIVTGQNIDQMAKFAQEANKAARALSATTTDYTNASLIYYQQGLNDQQVKERTDITIKMANVARESAEVVSDQMTAVWNNFYDGSKSLEHYADVMTALGAATASSTDEIAGGLEKFAAIGNTIGLSFEYAASALATITSNTRQSEEVVGTALKTIFARIQGLKLGESLEDGTDLNKYSEALQTVGISIYDSSGELKKMDNILDEMAAKWDNLSKAQQAALAQTVAGVRQYTQLIALMENWDNGDSDSMMANLTTSATSAGALQEQADIYAESWEAAQDRVTAALEAIYSSLIEDEAFIGLLNGVEKVINFVGELVDRLGGLKGTLLMIGTIVTKVFHSQLSQGLTNMAYNMKMMTEAGRKSVVNERDQFINDAVSMIPKNSANATDLEKAQQDSMRSQLTLQQELTENASKMSQYELEVNKSLLDRNRILQEQTVLATKNRDAAQQKVKDSQFALQSRIMSNVGKDGFGERDAQLTNEIKTIQQTSKAMADINGLFDQFSSKAKKGQGDVKALQQAILNLDTGNSEIQECISYMNDYSLTTNNAEKEVKELLAQILAIQNASKKRVEELIPVKKGEASQIRAEINGLVVAINEETDAERTRVQAVNEGSKAHDMAAASIRNYKGAQKSWSDVIVEGASLAMNTAMAFQMLGSTIDTLKDPDTSGWEKFTSVLMTLGMLIPTLISAWGSLKSLISTETVVKIANAMATLGQAAAEKQLNREKSGNYRLTKENIKNTIEDTKNKVKNGATNRSQSFKDNWTKKVIDKKYGGNAEKWANGAWHPGKGANNGGKLISGKEAEALSKGAAKGLTKAVAGAAIIAVTITAAVKIVEAAVKYYNRFDEAAEKAKETAKSMQATYETVKSAEEDFRNTIGQYQSGVEGLEKLTKGTEEYEDAVRSANNEAVKLLNTYDNLKYEIDDSGLIIIDESDLASAKRKSLQKEAIAFSAKTNAQQDADTAQLEADKVRFQREQMKTGGVHWDSDDTTAVAGGVGAGAALAGGAVAYTAIAASNVWNPVGWAMLIAGAVTAAIGAGIALFNNDADSREAETLAALEEFSTQNGGRDLTKEEIETIADNVDASGKLADSLLEDIDATNSMIAEMRANTEAMIRNNELIANQILQSNDYVAGSEHYDEIVKTSGQVEGIEYREALSEIQESGWGKDGISKASGANAEAKDVWDDYLKYAGKEDSGWELVDTKGTDTNRIFVYLDENGQRQEKTLVEMQKARASWEAAMKVNANANQLVGFFAEWAGKEDAADQAIASFLLNKNFEDATQNETDSVKNDITQNYGGDYESYLQAKLGNLDVAATRLGYESADKLVEAFINALNNSDSSWSDIDLGNLSSEVQKNTKVSDAKKISDIAIKMNAGLVKDGGDIFTQGINTLVSGLSAEEQEEALSRIANLDWSQWDAAYQAADIIRGLGYEVDTSSESFQEWANTMNEASGAAYDHAKALGDISKMQKMIEDLELGDIISKEDYDILVKYNDEIARYFRLLGDGTYKLVGDPLDAKQAIGEGIDKSYSDAVTGAENNYKKGQFRKDIDNWVKDSNFSREELGGSTWGVTETKEVEVQNDPNFGHYALGFLTDLLSPGETELATIDYAKMFAGTDKEQVEIEGIINDDLYNAQIDFIDQYLTDYTDAQIKEWRDNKTESNAEEIAGIVGDFLSDYDPISEDELTGLSTELQDLKDKQFSAEIDYARSADSSKELTQMYDEGQIGDQAYATAQLENATEEKWEGIDVQEVEDYADALMEAANNSELLDDNMSQEAAEDVALYVKKMNQGIKKLSDGFEDWKSILDDSSDAASEEFVDAMKNTKDAMSDVLGVSEDFISNQFILDHLEDIEKAANGDAEAIDRLAAELGRQIILDITVDESEAEKQALAAHDNLQALLEGKKVGFSVTADMDNSAIIDAANEVVSSAQMTVAEAQAYFNSLGYEPTFVTEEKDVEQRNPITITETRDAGTRTETLPDGKEVTWVRTATSSYVDGYTTQTGKMDVVALTSDGTPKIKSLTKKSSGAMNNNSRSNPGGKSGGGGSSSKPKKVKETKKSDVVDRYKEVEDQLDNVRDAQDKASKSADRLYGAARLKEMDKINKALEKEVDLLKDKKKEAEAYLKTDKAELEKATAESGISFTFDSETGDITNYTSEMNRLYDQLHAAEISANADGNATEEEQEKIDKINEKIEAVKSAYDQYEETKNLIEDLDSEIMDKIHEIQDNRFEKLNYKFEIKIEISENSLKWIDYQLGKLEDDFYSAAEAAALFFNTLNQGETKYGQTLAQVQMTTQQFGEAEKMYNTFDKDGNRLISQANYIEAMNQARDSYYDQLAVLQEVDDAMMNYYSDTLDKAMEELAKYTDQMDHLNGVMEHYNNLMSIMGKEKDYKSMGIILKGQAKLAEDRLAVAEASFNMLTQEKNTAYNKWQQALKDENAAAAELYEKEYRAALEKANEAEEEFLSSAEETLEAWKAELENTLAELGSNLEKALTGGKSFDWMTTTMERMNSLHEEYLTTTNKIYETNKMMRIAQQEIDKSSNSAAKRRLKQFVEETKELQDQTALSKFELDIQQAKYELLLAEIALEEAQNAKSQVRLQRDSEGNFGYVYTADTSAIDDAQQKYEDSQNNLYNISLEGANKYAEQRQQLLAEMYDTFDELNKQYQEGAFASEAEFNAAMEEAKTFYYERIRQTSELHNIAINADASASAEHIIGQENLVYDNSFTTFSNIAKEWKKVTLEQMSPDTYSWKKNVENYMTNVKKAFESWDKQCKSISEKTHLDNLAKKVNAITTESQTLVTEVTKPGGVLETLKEEFDAVTEVTGAYANQRAQIQGLIKDIEDYIKKLDKKQNAEANKKEEKPNASEESKTTTETKDTKKETKTVSIGSKVSAGSAYIYDDPYGRAKAERQYYGYDPQYVVTKTYGDWSQVRWHKGTQSIGWFKTADLTPFDTGGYTGDWNGSYGKLAMVHKKELILKEGDTANFLASMEVLERILSIIDLQSANAQYTANLNSPAFGKLQQETLEQNIHIEANFPHATDRNEIEEAFKDIVNLASQYANRK